MISNNKKPAIQLTDSAIKKVKYFIEHENNNLNVGLRVYIIGGGCGGFQYGFVLDSKINEDDCIIDNYGVFIIVDPMSLQYLFGGVIDYHEGLEGSKFIVINPNAVTTCSCGSSFSI